MLTELALIANSRAGAGTKAYLIRTLSIHAICPKGGNMPRSNITLDEDRKLQWDDFISKEPVTALKAIYDHASTTSQKARNWYWSRIKSHRRASVGVRALSYALAMIGVAGPLLAAARHDVTDKLFLTQIGVTAIAVAGLVQLGDNIFGCSSGWLRYITTVTAMERLTLQFQMDWAGYCVDKNMLGNEHKRALFDLTKAFELEIEKRRSEETDGWVAEFNRGMAALNEMIKFQKDATEKAAAAARAELESKAQSARPGAIEVSIAQDGSVKRVRVFLDDNELGVFTGPSWGRTGIVPGHHTLRLQLEDKSAEAIKIADVPAGGVARLDLKLP